MRPHTIASATDGGGEPRQCPVCRGLSWVEASDAGDAPCHHCGHLLWPGDGRGDSPADWPARTSAPGDREARLCPSCRGVTLVEPWALGGEATCHACGHPVRPEHAVWPPRPAPRRRSPARAAGRAVGRVVRRAARRVREAVAAVAAPPAAGSSGRNSALWDRWLDG